MNNLKSKIRRAAELFVLDKINAEEFRKRVTNQFAGLSLTQSSALADWIMRVTNER